MTEVKAERAILEAIEKKFASLVLVLAVFGIVLLSILVDAAIAFGAAGSIVVVLLLWSYWSAQIFFFGLDFTHVFAQEREA